MSFTKLCLTNSLTLHFDGFFKSSFADLAFFGVFDDGRRIIAGAMLFIPLMQDIAWNPF
jgi:hypothetical protein